MAIVSSIPGVSRGATRFMLAGQNISPYVDEMSLDISDTLGQGAGSGSGASARATTATFRSRLGPVSTAVGSGTPISSPQLVRNGELIIYDANGVAIFGGYAAKYTDATEKTTIYTKIDCYDYWQSLVRVTVNTAFSGQNDIQMIRALMSEYAPWVDLSLLPSTTGFAFTVKSFRNVTLQAAIQTITDVTGWLIWIDPLKRLHYVQPNQGSTAPFALSSAPDFRSSFQMKITDYEIDDNSAINRVYFYGGKKISNDFTQDLGPQANGNNTVFVLAYYPEVSSTGKVQVTVNGVQLVLGSALGTGDANTLISDGGTADALIDADAKTITMSTAPATLALVFAIYRYQLPLVTVLTDETSRKFFGGYLDGTISDETIFDIQQAVQRSRVLLLEQAYGLTSFKVDCWKAGIQVGQTIRVDDQVRHIHASFQVQVVHTTPLGYGQFKYEISLGAWNWNLVDIFKKSIQMATPQDSSSEDDSTSVVVQQAVIQAGVSDVWTKIPRAHGNYHAHATPLNDGQDGYAGFCSLG